MDLLTLGALRRLAFPQVSTSESVTAAGTTQATATALTATFNNVATGVANSGLLLPPAKSGRRVVVLNGTGNTIKIYPSGSSDQIDSAGAATAVTLTSGHRGAEFLCFSAGNWTSSLLGAATS
jgi:hypothetical protein